MHGLTKLKFGPKSEEKTRSWEKLHKCKLHIWDYRLKIIAV